MSTKLADLLSNLLAETSSLKRLGFKILPSMRAAMLGPSPKSESMPLWKAFRIAAAILKSNIIWGMDLHGLYT
jgi:hypothetical protein